MSESTAAAVDQAIANHIADAYPGFYTEGWIIVTVSSSIDDPRSKNYRILTPETQPYHADTGLISVGQQILNDQWCDEDEDD